MGTGNARQEGEPWWVLAWQLNWGLMPKNWVHVLELAQGHFDTV